MIEELRYLLKSNPGLYLAQVTQVSDLDEERSEYLVMLNVLPDRGECVAPQAFSDEKVQVGDIVILAIPADEYEYACILAVFPNTTNTIHERTDTGNRVLQARAGKKLNLVSDTRINIGKGGETEEAEPLVLGAVLTTYLNSVMGRLDTVCTQIATAATALKAAVNVIKTGPVADTCAPGSPVATGAALIAGMTAAATAMDALKSQFDSIKSGLSSDKSTYLTDAATNIKSQLAFTERGGS